MAKVEIDTDLLDSRLMEAIRSPDNSGYDIGFIHGMISSYWMLGLIESRVGISLSPSELVKGVY